MKKRKAVLIVLSILILIILFFLLKNYYKNSETGNNMSNKNIEEIEKYILSMSSYEAKISVTVQSNKNTNKYVIQQKYKSPNIVKQVVEEPETIAGTEIIYDGNNLTIKNSKYNLNKIYENYNYIANNFLFLDSFIKEYKEDNKLYEEKEEIIMETNVKINENNIATKKLYINKETAKPVKLVIDNINEKQQVYILYNEIKINNLEPKDVLAFKIKLPNAKLY